MPQKVLVKNCFWIKS